MYKLDENFLNEVGLGAMPQDQKLQMLRDIYDTLEFRVGVRLAETMSDAQLDEFEAVVDLKDKTASMKWLETNFPNYKQVVSEEFEKLKAEVKASAPQLMAVINQPSTQSRAA